MITDFLTSHFINNSDNVSDIKVRRAYGYLSGVVGIIVNLIIAIVEFIIGIMVNSLAITADAFHNITDVASSIITIIGFKISSKPADEEHPFGHGRVEYISAMLVSFVIFLIGYEFIKSSIHRIMHPSAVKFNFVSLVIILIAIPFKIWLSKFNKGLGKRINSDTLRASGIDALNDVYILSGACLSLILSRFTTIPVDGYIGAFVALAIMYSGFSIAKDTLNPLLGETPDPEMVKELRNSIISYEYISGVHDLVIHNYGPGRCMASAHAEVPCDISIVKIHEIIDRAEKEISKKMGLELIIHMDPLNTNDEDVKRTRKQILEVLKSFKEVKSLHDFRVVGDGEYKNILFDVVVSNELEKDSEEKLAEKINRTVKERYASYNTIVTIDRDYLQI